MMSIASQIVRRLKSFIFWMIVVLSTIETPDIRPQGKLYNEIERVAMGSALGPSLASFYMGDLENLVLVQSQFSPKIYCRYFDDILVINDETELES